jgi:hypothetical protein
MRKVPDALSDEPIPDRRNSRRQRIGLFVLIALLLALPVAEGSALCIGKWREVMGTNNEVRTPTLDKIGEHLGEAHESMGQWLGSHFQHIPWNPSYVLPIAAVVTLMGIAMLKR